MTFVLARHFPRGRRRDRARGQFLNVRRQYHGSQKSVNRGEREIGRSVCGRWYRIGFLPRGGSKMRKLHHTAPGFRRTSIPATKSLMSGTRAPRHYSPQVGWLFLPAPIRARLRLKNAVTLGIPFSIATWLHVFCGLMPTPGMPMALKIAANNHRCLPLRPREPMVIKMQPLGNSRDISLRMGQPALRIGTRSRRTSQRFPREHIPEAAPKNIFHRRSRAVDKSSSGSFKCAAPTQV